MIDVLADELIGCFGILVVADGSWMVDWIDC